MNTPDTKQLEKIAARLRGRVIELSHRKKSAHLGSCLSSADILTALYWGALGVTPETIDDPARDKLIFSKGHAAMVLYVALAMRGFFPEERLAEFAEPGSSMGEHPIHRGVPGLEAATGSLGHGLPLGAGMALAAKIRGLSSRVFVVMSDGECNEGSVWEAAMFAPANGLDNLVAIIDFNRWQATGRSCEIMKLEPLREKWESFGWSAHNVDGHDVEALRSTLSRVPDGSGRPVAVIAATVKGKGVSFMQDDNNWHYRIPTAEEVEKALKELGLK